MNEGKRFVSYTDWFIIDDEPKIKFKRQARCKEVHYKLPAVHVPAKDGLTYSYPNPLGKWG